MWPSSPTTLILAYSGLTSVPKHDEQTPAPDPCTTESLVPPPEYSRHQLGSLPYFHQISAKSHLSGIRSQITLQEIVPSFPTVLLFCIVSLFTIYICSLALPHLSPKSNLHGNRDCFVVYYIPCTSPRTMQE